MQDFRFHLHAPVFFGRDSVTKHADLIATFGKKVYIVTTKFPSGCENLALNDVLKVCKEQNIDYKVFDETEENPSMECCVKMTLDAKEFQPDFFIGVGGGSSMDAAKCVSVLYEHDVKTPDEGYDVLFLNPPPNPYKMRFKGKPVICIPTTAGSSSEITGGYVITRKDTGTKDTPSIVVFSEASFVDPKYIETAPQMLLDTGAMDALSHGIETYLNTKSYFLSQQIAQIGFGLFREFKDGLLSGNLTTEDYDKITLHSVIMGMAFYQAGTLISHGLGYYLSQHKHLNHGLACSITQGEYLKVIPDQSLVTPVMNACGFDSVDAFADYVKVITNRDVDISVTKAECREWAEHFMKVQSHRLPRHPGTLDADILEGIFLRSLAAYIKE